MKLRAVGFDWDAGNWPKCAKHGVSKEDIEAVLRNARFVVDDPNPTEKRFRTAGPAGEGRFVFVAFALRKRSGVDLIRPISARYMHAKEIASYEEEMARIEKR